ncbi:MAG TPA: branched-chain amino acid ABC transporter permease [Thermoleophilia bacterium]|nr:branched-chain amino acid ABC transporter permease [Thermoleophilia bacterium]
MSGVDEASAGKSRLARTLAWSRTPIWPTVAVVVVLAFIPLVWRNDYYISLFVLILLFAIMTQSWNITIGMCGIWNFGQLAIIALGGYATGLLVVKLGISPWLALLAGVVAGGVSAVIMVLPSIRLRGIYASMLTFAFAEVVRLLIIADSTGFTGGPFGLPGVTGLFDWLSPSWSLRAYFWLTLVLTAAVMLFVHRMMNSPFGMGLVSLRESIRFSIGMGINRRVAFIMATAVSGLIAGLAGGLYATFYHGITPSFMGLGPMGLLVIMVVVGGLGTVRGPIIGAFVVTMLSELLRDTVMWRLVVQGALLLIVLAFWPAGLDGLFERGYDRVRAWMNAGQDEGRPGVPAAAVAEGSTDQAAGRVAAAAVTDQVQRADRTDVAAAEPARPTKKVGRFKAWLNADQPPKPGDTAGGPADDPVRRGADAGDA